MKMSERKKKELILNRESQQFLSIPWSSIYQYFKTVNTFNNFPH